MRDAAPVNTGADGEVPDAEAEAEPEGMPEPTALADEGRGIAGVGPTTMLEPEEEEVMAALEEGLGLEAGVLMGTETGMEEGV